MASMRVISILIFFLLGFSAINSSAQRSHEVQVQFGVMFNKGVSFYDYKETDTKRHNFEFDQKYTSSYYNFSWRYPVNSYIETGIYFSHSIRASLLLLEAESILFDSQNPGTRSTSPLFLGETRLSSKNREIGIEVRATIVRFNKFKSYVMLNAGIQQISVTHHATSILEVQDPGLRNDLLQTYLVDENIHSIGIGLGLSRLLSSGVNIKIVEVYGRNLPENKLLLAFPISFEIRTGVSYQFYKRK
jgi:hypothetical protein